MEEYYAKVLLQIGELAITIMLNNVENFFKVSYPDDRLFNLVISDSSVVLRETTRTISDSIETGSPVKSEIVRVVSLNSVEEFVITRYKDPRS